MSFRSATGLDTFLLMSVEKEVLNDLKFEDILDIIKN
jgi:hypothetical protein